MKYTKYTKKDFEWVNWTPAQIKQKGDEVIERVSKNIEKVKNVSEKRTFENTFSPLEEDNGVNEAAIDLISILENASTKEKVRQAAHETIIKVGNELSKLQRDIDLYKAISSYNPKSEKLEEDQKIIVRDTMRSFKKMGFHLPEDKQKELLKLTQQAQKLSAQYAQNVNNHKDQLLISKEDASSLPKNFLETLKKDKKTGKYIVTLSTPDYIAFMQNCESEKLRKEYRIKALREGGRKNITILKKLIEVRDKKAKMVGYKTYADMVIDGRMAKNSDNVMNLLKDIGQKINHKVSEDNKKLLKAKQKHLSDNKVKLHNWDVGYYSNKILKEEFNVDQDLISEYLPLDHVMKIMFEHFGSLYGFDVKKADLPVWEKSVQWFKIVDKKQTIGYIAFDFFPRQGKYTHQAVWPVIVGGYHGKQKKLFNTPVSIMIGNFSKPSKNKPALIRLGEVRTLFHEFGHMLHNALSTTRYSSQAGTMVAHDFVELPSQFNERWLSESNFLKKLGKHYKTGKPLPNDLIDSIKKARGFQRASSEASQNMMALYDMTLHTNISKIKDINSLYNNMYKKYMKLDMPKEALFPASFGHLASQYGAGYYGYKWAEIYAHDVFSVFKEKGIYNKSVGKKYRKEILEKGSSRDELESLKKFLGRKPNNKAFLKYILG